MAKRILILYADAGFGHKKAAEALEAAFKEIAPDDEVFLENPLKDPALPEIARQLEAGYDEVIIEEPLLWNIAYSVTDTPLFAQFMQNVSSALLSESIKRLIIRTNPHAIISTHPSFSKAMVTAVADFPDSIKVNVVITDLVNVHSYWFNKKVDITFTPTGYIYRQALNKGFDKNRLRLLGLPVHPDIVRENRSRDVIRKSLGWEPEQRTALIVGSIRTTDEVAITMLLDRAGLDLQIAVVAGGNKTTEDELRLMDWRGSVHIYGYVRNLPEMMHASDFIICKAGGLITTESLACGLPLIFHEALPGQEEGNVKYVTEGAAGVYAPGAKGVLAETVSWLAKDAALLKQYQQGAKRLGKPRAAYDIGKTVLSDIDGAMID